jgi:DNA-binding PadR family transcriptional regulator
MGLPWALAGLFRKGTRARRGDVRAAILSLLAEEPRNGYQIMQELEQRSRGSWRPSPGSVYPALQLLEDEGLVRAEEASAGGRVFQLTDRGKAYVKEHKEEMGAPWEAMGGAPVEENAFALLFGEIRHIAAATAQIAQTGGKAQLALAQKVLSDARRDLYRLLADGDSAEDDE